MTDLDDLRSRIDEITLQMIRLLDERTKISAQIGAIKKTRNLNVNNESREADLHDMASRAADDLEISGEQAARFLNYLLGESIRQQSGTMATHLSIFRKAKEMEQNGRTIIHMEVGEPDFAPPPLAGKALLEGFEAGHTRYGLPAGMPQVRAALAGHLSSRYSSPLTQENILVTPGARFAVFSAITTLLGPGDEIIIIEPTWPAYREAAFYAGAKPRMIHTTLENGWEPSPSEIEDAITPRTRMIVLCYPSNPTGKILPTKIMDQIMEIASRHRLYVLSDEIYHDYHYTATLPKSVLEYGYDRSIATQSFSKSHAMMGFRIGYAAAHPEIINRMARVSALCLTGVAGVIQYAALKVITHDSSGNVRTIGDRLRTITDMGRRAGLEFADPDGAMYVFARAPGRSGMEIVEECLERGLALAPGTGFGHYPEFVRISAGTESVADGMHILRDVLHDKGS